MQRIRPHFTTGMLILTLMAFLLGIPGKLQAEDWPQWRGPDRDGKSPETGLLDAWPEDGPRLLWKTDGLGGGYSTPTVAQGKVFGMGYVQDRELVWALSERTGKLLWKQETTKAFRDMGYSDGPRSSPTVDGAYVYTLGGGGNLVCLKASDGSVSWKREFKEEFGGRMMSGWGFSESVLIDGDKLICTPGAVKGTLLALDKSTGKELWQSRGFKDKAAYASVIAVEHGGKRQYIVYTSAHVAGVDAANGKVLWQAPRKGRTAVIPTPVFHEGNLYVSSGYGVGCNLFEIKASGGDFSARQVYANKNMINHHGGVIRLGDHVYGYCDKKGWVCQEMASGEVVWSHKGVGKGSLSYADGRLYLRSERSRGTVALIEATPKGYQEHGRFDQPDRSRKNSWPHPVIANGKLLLRDQGILLCYDIKE